MGSGIGSDSPVSSLVARVQKPGRTPLTPAKTLQIFRQVRI